MKTFLLTALLVCASMIAWADNGDDSLFTLKNGNITMTIDVSKGGKTHIELESQGAYTLLQPGEQLVWTVRWYLLPADGEACPSEGLMKKVRNVIR